MMFLKAQYDRRKKIVVLFKRGKCVFKNQNECWLDTNLAKGLITNDQHFAGIRLRFYYERTEPKTTINYTKDRIDWGSNFLNGSESKMNALEKLKNINKEVGHKDYRLLILHCAQDYNYSEIGKLINATRQTISKRMKVALSNLFYIFNRNIV